MFKQFQKKSFWIIIFIMSITGLSASIGLYYGRQWLTATYPEDLGKSFVIGKVSEWMAFLGQDSSYQWVLPGILISFILFGILLWGSVSVGVANLFKRNEEKVQSPQSGKVGKKDFVDQKIEQERKRRLFLHTLSVLQREGRLLDFFDEDLSRYEDGQIGAAVRSIQEDCKRAIKKYIDPKPVVQGEEGDAITIEAGFDIDAINLVGNVSGQPPFNGVIKHPGWKAGKKDVPKLSDIQDSGIMTPAEIEIQ